MIRWGVLADCLRPSSARISNLEEENRNLRMRLDTASRTSSVNAGQNVELAGLQSTAKANLALERSSETSTPSVFNQNRDIRSRDIKSNDNGDPQSSSGEYIYHGLTSTSALEDTSWSHVSRDTTPGPQASTEWIHNQLEAEASQQRGFSLRN